MTLTKINGYPMDLEISAALSLTSDVTSRPVEIGGQISDHIRNNPDELTLVCIVSDSPTGAAAADPTRAIADGTILNTEFGSFDTPLPSEDAWARLVEMHRAARPVVVESVSIGRLDQMGVISIERNEDKDTTGGLFFTVKLKRMRIVTNRRSRVPVRSAMPGAGGAARAVGKAGIQIQIDKKVTWRHGLPPGAPWRPGNPVELVGVSYNDTPGFGRDERAGLNAIGVSDARVNPGSSLVTYVDVIGSPITGDRRAALVADLFRDRYAAIERQRTGIGSAAGGISGPLRGNLGPASLDRNLPDGLNLSRFQSGPTDPTISSPQPTAQDLDFSRFRIPRPLTFGGGG